MWCTWDQFHFKNKSFTLKTGTRCDGGGRVELAAYWKQKSSVAVGPRMKDRPSSVFLWSLYSSRVNDPLMMHVLDYEGGGL